MRKIVDFITIVVFIILLLIVVSAQKPTEKQIINSVSASVQSQNHGN